MDQLDAAFAQSGAVDVVDTAGSLSDQAQPGSIREEGTIDSRGGAGDGDLGLGESGNEGEAVVRGWESKTEALPNCVTVVRAARRPD